MGSSSEYNREYYKKHREKIIKNVLDYKQRYPEKTRKLKRQWADNNKEKNKKHKLAWIKRNPDKIKQNQRNNVKKLNDAYIIHLIRRRYGLSTKEIRLNSELINTVRSEIKIKRLLKQKKNVNKKTR